MKSRWRGRCHWSLGGGDNATGCSLGGGDDATGVWVEGTMPPDVVWVEGMMPPEVVWVEGTMPPEVVWSSRDGNCTLIILPSGLGSKEGIISCTTNTV